ncbi:MAG TPA: rod shape-determining protein MreD [Acidimicrobiia bacterium]|jgi:rod shape-determining protein MreD|nr:rod shape-determining protein MreD [Acidimicrobiia bacterium]
MRPRALGFALLSLVVAVVLQTTLFVRFRIFTPDLVLLLSILFAITDMRREGVLVMAFTGGLIVDLLSSNLLGLRAAVFSVIAFLAVRTVHRVDIGPVAVAIWAGLLTLVGVVLFLLLGTLFGQGGLVATDLGRRLVFVPLSNLVVSFAVAPLLNRLITGRTRGLI